jgi:hypothetical protein
MTDERAIGYLLEELTTSERERFEEELFSAAEWPADLPVIESDLIDAYLRGELSPERRKRFEVNYLRSDVRRKRVTMAAALLRCIDESGTTPAHRPGWLQRLWTGWTDQALAFRVAAVTAVVAVALATVWLIGFRTNPPQTFADLSLNITNITRSEGSAVARVSVRERDALRITLAVPEAAQSATKFKIELEDPNGQKHHLEIAGRDARNLIVVVPKSMLNRGQYMITLSSSNGEGPPARLPGGYYFEVE